MKNEKRNMVSTARQIANQVKEDKRSHVPPKRPPPPGYEEIKPRCGTVEVESKMPFSNNLLYLLREQSETIKLIEREIGGFEYRFFNEGADKTCDELCDELSRGFERDVIETEEQQLRRLQSLLARMQRINNTIFGEN